MRLTTMTDYAMRLLMYVAQQPDRLCTIAEVANAYGISEAHLMKITHQLGLSGWLETVRGKGGGMRLAAAPADINVGAVVRSIEPDFYLVEPERQLQAHRHHERCTAGPHAVSGRLYPGRPATAGCASGCRL
jgi:Rrf2 family protein